LNQDDGLLVGVADGLGACGIIRPPRQLQLERVRADQWTLGHEYGRACHYRS